MAMLEDKAMERSLVTLDDLSAWLTEQVSAMEDCEGTTVTVQYALREPDADGCNWSESNIVFNAGRHASRDAVFQHIANLIPEARRRFNVR